MHATHATPVLPGRAAYDHGALMMGTVWSLLLQGLLISLWWNAPGAEPGGLWFACFWAALLSDAWASMTALRQAGRGVPRPVNRWDFTAAILLVASVAAVPIVFILAAKATLPSTTAARAVAMALLSVLVLAWFLRRANLRTRLLGELRGWPRDDWGRRSIPARASSFVGTNFALGLCGWSIAFLMLDSPFILFVPLGACLAAEYAALTRRATETWWERPPVGFSKQDLLSLVVAYVGLSLSVVVLVQPSPVIAAREWNPSALAYSIILIWASAQAIVRGTRRWRRRHAPTDWLSVWD